MAVVSRKPVPYKNSKDPRYHLMMIEQCLHGDGHHLYIVFYFGPFSPKKFLFYLERYVYIVYNDYTIDYDIAPGHVGLYFSVYNVLVNS